MRIPGTLIIFLLPALSLVLPALPESPSENGQSKLSLRITVPQNQATYSSADLKFLPHISVSVKNGHSDAQETYSGVRVADLLAKLGAPLGKEMRGKAMAGYILATGADGYKVVFSIAEVDPEFHPGEIIVADEMNGKPLDDSSGPLKLVATEDRRPARWVRKLIYLELKSPD